MWRHYILCYLFFFIPSFSVATFTSTPDNVAVCAGRDVDLIWGFGSVSNISELLWSKEGTDNIFKVDFNNSQVTNLFTESEVMYLQNKGIKIKAVSKQNAGNYTVQVFYTLSSGLPTVTDRVEVTVLDPPTEPYFTITNAGSNPTYTCGTESAGTPPVDVKIQIGGQLQKSESAAVNFTHSVDCCVVGDAVACMSLHSSNKFCTNAISPTGPDDMKLSPSTPVYTLKIGDKLEPVICSAKCTPNCTFQWTKNKTIVASATNLSFIIADKGYRGVYTCTAYRGLFIKDTRNITLNVRYGPEEIVMDPEDSLYTENENSSFSVKCSSDCYPPCTYTWEREREGHNNVLAESQNLSFSSLKRNDSGQYVCTVTNKQASIPNQTTRSITIAVRYGPDQVSFDPTASPYIGNETEALKITCISSCYPDCSYTWKRGGDNMSSAAVLNFTSLIRTQAGTYTCTAKNSYSLLFNSVTASVVVIINYGPDSAIISPTTTTYTVNSSTTIPDINCTSNCVPMCSNIWIKEGILSEKVAENGVLQLGNLSKKDAGNYTCTAKNPKLPLSKTAQVAMYVRYGPDNISITPAGPTYSAVEGFTLPDFICSSECYPGCSQTWDSVTAALDLASENVLSLGIANRTFTGEYRCTSTNKAQEFNKSLNKPVFLTIQYHPDVTVSQINGTYITEGSQNIMLICAAKGDPEDYNFTEWIHYAPDGSTEIRKLSASLADNDRAYLKFLNTSYMDSGTYKCGVTNGIPNFTTKHQFAYADATQVVKGRPVITEWKKDVVSHIHDNSSLLVTYYSNDGSIPVVKWYRTENDTIQERHANEDKMFFENSQENVTVEFYSAKVVLPGYKTVLFIQNVSQSDIGYYNISVSNSVGTSFMTLRLNAQGAPGPPNMFSVVQGSVTLSSLILTWTCGFHGGADQTFYIQYNTSSSPWQTKAFVYGGQLENTRFNETIDQLSAETQYFFRIFAANEYGNSSFSNILTATTENAAEDLPAPSNVGLIAGATAGGVGLAAVTVVLVLLFFRRRQDHLKSPSKRLLKDKERSMGTNGADDTPEINLNPMYESAGPAPSASNNSDVYSQVDKSRKKAKPVGDIYSQVDKPKKRQHSDSCGIKNDVYSQVQKQAQKERDAGKTKQKKQKPDRKTKKGKQAEGDLYDIVDTSDSTATQGDTVYENPSCSIEDEQPKQIRNQDELIYADLDLPKETVGKNKKAIIHGLDDRTDYADIKYGEVGEQVPDTYEDEESPKKE